MIAKNLRSMLHASWLQTIVTTVLVSFLLLLLNILGVLSHGAGALGDEVKSKLGMYFYLDEAPDQESEVYASTITLMDQLEQAGLRVEFYSKEDAIELLESRLPNVIKNFEEYGIDNPLPPTLYVMFDNEDQYDSLKNIIADYQHIIVNLDDLTDGITFAEQERTVANVISMTNFLQFASYFLICVLVVVIVTYL